MALTAIIVSQGIQKGIEAANKIMMPSLYLILIHYSVAAAVVIEPRKYFIISLCFQL